MIKKITFKSIDEIKNHIKKNEKTLYTSSKTSTVIPYEKIEEYIGNDDLVIGDLSQMPKELSLNENKNLIVKGAVSWKEAKEYLSQNKRTIKTSPTEELALVSAGAATSATGERCFHFGNLRSQIKKITYLNSKGEEKTLHAKNKLPLTDKLKSYQEEFKPYETFKNAPFPRMEYETDLLIGTEGQLGVITELELETSPELNLKHLFFLTPRWEEDDSYHIEIINKVQNFREDSLVCEFIDSNSFNYLKPEDRPNNGKDAFFFEVKEECFDHFYENFLKTLNFLNEDEIFIISENKFHHIRASIPRAVFEENSRMGVVKMGTDVQVKTEDFKKLLSIYREFTKLGLRYNLFGHFGDAHLHFNFMPTPHEINLCKEKFKMLYKEVLTMKGSPFAEHGIGFLKKDYIKDFHGPNILSYFKELKDTHDIDRIFFPQGFLNV